MFRIRSLGRKKFEEKRWLAGISHFGPTSAIASGASFHVFGCRCFPTFVLTFALFRCSGFCRAPKRPSPLDLRKARFEFRSTVLHWLIRASAAMSPTSMSALHHVHETTHARTLELVDVVFRPSDERCMGEVQRIVQKSSRGSERTPTRPSPDGGVTED